MDFRLSLESAWNATQNNFCFYTNTSNWPECPKCVEAGTAIKEGAIHIFDSIKNFIATHSGQTFEWIRKSEYASPICSATGAFAVGAFAAYGTVNVAKKAFIPAPGSYTKDFFFKALPMAIATACAASATYDWHSTSEDNTVGYSALCGAAVYGAKAISNYLQNAKAASAAKKAE